MTRVFVRVEWKSGVESSRKGDSSRVTGPYLIWSDRERFRQVGQETRRGRDVGTVLREGYDPRGTSIFP